MDVVFHLPPGTMFLPPLPGHNIAPVYAVGGAMIMLLDLNMVHYEIIHDAPPVEPPPPTPTPTPTPTPVETELFVVVVADRLNVRKDHSRTAEIMRRLNPGEEFPVIKGVDFDDAPNKILWRKTIDNYWVAVTLGDDVYAKLVDTTLRGG